MMPAFAAVFWLGFPESVAGRETGLLASVDGALQAEVKAEARASAVHKPRKDGNDLCMNESTSESGDWLQPLRCIMKVSIFAYELTKDSKCKFCRKFRGGWGLKCDHFTDRLMNSDARL